MNVGDLIRMRGGQPATGIVIKMHPDDSNEKPSLLRPRVGVFWSDGGGVIDWEPMHWLEVVSEGR